MTQQVQELIDKIKNEGIEAARQKPQEIETEAQKKAQQIIQEAQAKANRMMTDAKEEIKKSEAASRMALSQASRNTLLGLRKEIENTLKKIIIKEVQDTLTHEQLFDLLSTTIKTFLSTASNGGSVEITLKPQDSAKIKDAFLTKLQSQIKKTIEVKASDEVGRGFVISFDGGKSSFDFSDESLAEYLASYLNREIADLVKSSVHK